MTTLCVAMWHALALCADSGSFGTMWVRRWPPVCLHNAHATFCICFFFLFYFFRYLKCNMYKSVDRVCLRRTVKSNGSTCACAVFVIISVHLYDTYSTLTLFPFPCSTTLSSMENVSQTRWQFGIQNINACTQTTMQKPAPYVKTGISVATSSAKSEQTNGDRFNPLQILLLCSTLGWRQRRVTFNMRHNFVVVAPVLLMQTKVWPIQFIRLQHTMAVCSPHRIIIIIIDPVEVR